MGRFLALLLISLTAQAGPTLLLDSGDERVRLIELYTSEGCYSCPPADQWIGRLRDDARLWRELVPVAFHVDYWDYIGWPDRFASPLYSSRQRNYRVSGTLSSVYTPGLLLDGMEWRRWFRNRHVPENAAEAGGRLKVAVTDQTVEAVFDARSNAASATLHLAILGFELWTDVGAGENDGKRLEHNFVVLGYDNGVMRSDGKIHSLAMALPETRFPSARYALAVWTTLNGQPQPVQATGGWLSAP